MQPKKDIFADIVGKKEEKPKSLRDKFIALPEGQKTILLAGLDFLDKADKLTRGEDQTQINNMAATIMSNINDDTPFTSKFIDDSRKVLFNTYMTKGRVQDAVTLYDKIKNQLEVEVKGLQSLNPKLLEEYLKKNKSSFEQVREAVGEPDKFTTPTTTQREKVRTFGTAKVLEFLLNRGFNVGSGECKMKDVEKSIKSILPDLDLKILEDLCKFSDKYRDWSLR